MGKLPRGVSLTAQGRFQSRIYRNGASVHLGVFDDVDEAAAAYRTAFIARKNSIANPPATSGCSVPDASVEATLEPAQPVQAPTENTPEMPTAKPTPIPAAVRKRPTIVLPGCCPECGSSLYALAPSAVSDDDKLCRQCAHRPRRAQIDEHGCRVFSREPEVFVPAGISRRQIDSAEWLELNKGRGVIR